MWSAISSISAILPTGILSISLCITADCIVPWINGVATYPGQTALILMPLEA